MQLFFQMAMHVIKPHMVKVLFKAEDIPLDFNKPGKVYWYCFRFNIANNLYGTTSSDFDTVFNKEYPPLSEKAIKIIIFQLHMRARLFFKHVKIALSL